MDDYNFRIFTSPFFLLPSAAIGLTFSDDEAIEK